jgi:hypothetical protein
MWLKSVASVTLVGPDQSARGVSDDGARACAGGLAVAVAPCVLELHMIEMFNFGCDASKIFTH